VPNPSGEIASRKGVQDNILYPLSSMGVKRLLVYPLATSTLTQMSKDKAA